MKYAAEIAQASDFIEAKPSKFESPVSQDGTNVSGGQRQRLSIARAIAKKPKVFLFDDSFSALDYKTDAALRHALDEHIGEATKLIVAQRISTIMHAEPDYRAGRRECGRDRHAQRTDGALRNIQRNRTFSALKSGTGRRCL